MLADDNKTIPEPENKLRIGTVVIGDFIGKKMMRTTLLHKRTDL